VTHKKAKPDWDISSGWAKAKWCTAKGEVVEYKDMDSQHLFNSIRMVFNNIAPEELQIPGGNRYEDIKDWPKDACHGAIHDMIEELELRKASALSGFFSELSPQQWKDIAAIKVFNEMKMI
jgi:hypothetical protein